MKREYKEVSTRQRWDKMIIKMKNKYKLQKHNDYEHFYYNTEAK